MTRRALLLRRLARNRRGTAITEFALTAPLFLMLLLGIVDYCTQMYAQQVLQGAVSQSARAATLEDFADDQIALDAFVRSRVQQVFKHAEDPYVTDISAVTTVA